MSRKSNKLISGLKLFIISGKAEGSTCGTEHILQTYYIIATTKRSAISQLNKSQCGSDEIWITDIQEVYYYNFQITDVAYKKIEDVVLENMV